MPAATTMLLRHARARTRALLTSPPDLALLAIAAAGSLFTSTFIPRALLALRDQPFWPVVLGFAGLSWWLWPWLLVRPVSGGRVAVGQQWHRTLPMPALPIGLRRRLLAEAAAGLLLVLALRMVMAPVLFLSFYEPRYWSSLLWWNFALNRAMAGVPWSLAGAALALPVLLAWLAPARSEAAYVSRPLLVAALALWGLVWPWPPTTPDALWLRAILLGAGLSPLVLVAFARVGGAAIRPVPHPGPLAREATEPEARFRRDAWQCALRPLAWSLVGALVLFGGLLLRSAGVFRVFEHFLSALLAFGLLARVWTQPFGISVFVTDAMAGSRSLFGGAFARAWSGLPVRPEAVRRAVYLHGLASAALVALAFAAHSRLAAALGVGWWSWRGDLLLALGAPCAAGFLLCAAVGDRLRGTLSAAALFSLPAAFVWALAGLAVDGSWPRLPTLVALAVVGGVPPLAHLRRRSSHGPRAALRAAALVLLLPLASGGCSGADPVCVVPAHGARVKRPPAVAVDVADPVWMRCTGGGPRPAEAPAIASLREAEGDAGRQPPRPIHTPQPCYPEAAFEAGVQGVVEVELLIGEDGTVAEAGVVRSIPELDAAALDSICRWSFLPAEQDGRAVPHVARAPFSFGIY